MDGEKEPGERKKLFTLSQKRQFLTRSKALTAMNLLESAKTNIIFQSVPEMETVENGSGDLVDEGPFPSLPDNVLKILGLMGKREGNKNLNEPDIEEKFARLSLAFKTDKFTLSKRLELQQRQRDIAEKNIESELKSLRESLNALNQLCTDSDMREVITKTQQHVDIVQQTTMRMSSRAETFGAIQQEQRMNSAFETMLSYVEHLKLLYDKEHMELEEYRRLLAEHNLLPDEKGPIDSSDDPKRILPPRSHSLSSSSKPESRSRLLSAVCLLSTNPEPTLTINGNSSSSSNLSLSPKSRRASMPVGPLNTAVQAPQSFKLFPTETSTRTSDKVVSDKEDSQRLKETLKQISSTKTGSIGSDVKSEDDRDCDICQEITALPCVGECHATNKDSSDQRLSCGSSFDDKDEALPCFESILSNLPKHEISAFCNCEEIVPTTCCSSLSLLRLFHWTVDQGVWHCDGRNLMLRCRYLLSAVLATAAMLSFLLTFLPHIIEFALI